MPLFELKSLSKEKTLENVNEDYRASRRVEQYRVSNRAIYFPGFPGNRYLPYEALSHVKTKNTAISVTGTCGKQIPMVCVRVFYDGEFYRDFMFEKSKNAERMLEAIRTCRPDLLMEKDAAPLWAGV